MKFFQYIYSFYAWSIGGLLFLFVMLIGILMTSFIPPKKFKPVFSLLLKIPFAFLFIRVKVKIPDNFDYAGRYVFMPNHVSLMDSPLMAAYMPQFIIALEAKEHFAWPVYGKLVAKWGNIPIDRKSIRASFNSIKLAGQRVKNENSIIVFPEGGRTSDGQLRKFKKMPFHLAKEAGVSIVPIGILGIYSINPKGTWLLKPGKVSIKIGNPISVEKVKADTIDGLMEKTREEVLELIEQ